jgi:hypothetical protein
MSRNLRLQIIYSLSKLHVTNSYNIEVGTLVHSQHFSLETCVKYFCDKQNMYEASHALKGIGKFADSKAARPV